MNKNKPKKSNIPIWLVVSVAMATACAKPSQSLVQCAETKSLLRFDLPSVDGIQNIEDFRSHGGFIEVFTRKDPLGKIDHRRLCTAYVEYADNPADPGPSDDSAPLRMSVYTATHCLDLSRDYELKLHIFDGSIYRDFWVEHKPLRKANELRAAMKKKGLSSAAQTKVLTSLRSSATNVEELFNAKTITSDGVGLGGSDTAGRICLQKPNPDIQHVCATYQDITMLKVEPSVDSPVVVLNELKKLRRDSNVRAASWISKTKLALNEASTEPKKLFFSDEPARVLNLSALHGEMRNRLSIYSSFKQILYVQDSLGADFQQCYAGGKNEICAIGDEFSELLKAQLLGTGYEVFENKKLNFTVDVLKSGLNSAMSKMDKSFSVFEPFYMENNSGSKSLGLKARLHSNFRLVPFSAGTEDKPDPKDSFSSGRGFFHFDLNNLTADVTGNSVHFVRWVESPSSQVLGRFLHFPIPKQLTDKVKANYEPQEANNYRKQPANAGFLQAGDSGSIVVIEHLPFFAVSSVDGQSTSGGTSISPLPEAVDESEFIEVKRDGMAAVPAPAAKKKSPVACR